mgnify:CR=1 FL=1
MAGPDDACRTGCTLGSGDPEALAKQKLDDASLDHDNPLEEVYEDQLLCADLIVLNKADLLSAAERGLGSSLNVLGYRLAMIVSGGLALIWTDPNQGGGWSWPEVYRFMAGVMVVAAVVSAMWIAGERLDGIEWAGAALIVCAALLEARTVTTAKGTANG